MIDALALTVVISCVGVGTTVIGQAVGGRISWRRVAPALIGVQVALVLQVLLDGLSLIRGHSPREPVTHVAYSLVSVLVLPVVVGQTRGEDGRWAGVLTGVAMLALAVIVVRMETTWGHA